MSKRSVLTSLALITIGIIFGAVLVSNFSSGVNVGQARGTPDVKLGGPTPITNQSEALKAVSDNFVAVAKAVTPSVVAITVTTTSKGPEQNLPDDFFRFFHNFKMPEQEKSQGFGSGVIITPDGYIATNNHVVEGADKDGIMVTMHDKIRYQAKLIGTDPSTDIAVIKIEAKDLPAAALGNSDNVQVGEWAVAIGNPLGLTSTVTAGIISAIGRGNIGVIQGRSNDPGYGIEDFIQTDAAINPGNSGGPLVNMKGEVVGINTAIATTNARYQGYGFAVPVNLVKTVAADLIKNGKVLRGYIGMKIQTVDQTLADAIGLKKAEGVIVQEVVKGGAGEAADLKAGDVILSVDGKEVNESNELQSLIAMHHPGDQVVLKVFRGGKEFEKTVTLKGREEEAVAVKNAEQSENSDESTTEEPKTTKFDALGMTVRPLTSDEKKSLDVEKGAVITDVKPYTEAFNRGLAKNDVIVSADRKPVSGPGDLKQILSSKNPGDAVLFRIKNKDGQTNFVAVQLPK